MTLEGVEVLKLECKQKMKVNKQLKTILKCKQRAENHSWNINKYLAEYCTTTCKQTAEYCTRKCKQVAENCTTKCKQIAENCTIKCKQTAENHKLNVNKQLKIVQ